ncbi:thioredoxin family protein, partial [Candidatus Saccharibacteria bacterium]|nr:thioredoxin family protein [Candidatus Saccharibacteria bacterium]
VIALLVSRPSIEEPVATTDTTQTPQSTETPDQSVVAGRYALYSPEAVASQDYTQTVLFFHAPWCPECRAFETAIEASTIPEGVQILKVDYDSSTDLRQKHGVTLQSTFVEVDQSGETVSRWVGYGKDKSVTAILENL